MECERPQGAELRQGDIFAAHPGTEFWKDPLKRFGVILSADCDLQQRKTGPTVVYAPILGLHNYIVHSWLPSQVTKARTSGIGRLGKALVKLGIEQIQPESALQMSDVEFDQLVARAQSLQDNPTYKDRERNIKLVKTLRQKLSELSALNSQESVCTVYAVKVRLMQFFTIDDILKNSGAPNRERYRSQLNNALQALGDKERLDTWPICDLIGLDGDMRDDEPFGFVVALRQFSLMPVDKIRIKRGQWQNDPDSLLRICRLRGIYKTDLLQRFANLFVRVGMEDERLEIHRSMFERAASKLIMEGVA